MVNSSKVQTFQPYVLMTSNYELIKNFINKQNESFSDILLQYPNARDFILISPTVTNSNFLSFDYSLGYDKNEMFSINVTLSDPDGNLETNFIKFLFQEQRYRKIVENTFIKEAIERNKSLPSPTTPAVSPSPGSDPATPVVVPTLGPDGEPVRPIPFYDTFGRPTNIFNPDIFSKKIDDYLKGKIEGYTYFVFGINNKISSPIVTQFKSAEASLAQDGFKKIKLNFMTMGHPNALSELTNLKPTLNNLSNVEVLKTHKEYVLFDNTRDVNLLDLVDKKLFNYFIREVIKNLFTRITSKEIILLLPDFDKLYEKFVTTYSFDSRIRSIISIDTMFNNSANALAKSQVYKWYSAASFLRQLGFTVKNDFFKKSDEKYKNISEESKQKIEVFLTKIKEVQKRMELFNLKWVDVDNFLNKTKEVRLAEYSEPFRNEIKDKGIDNTRLYFTDFIKLKDEMLEVYSKEFGVNFMLGGDIFGINLQTKGPAYSDGSYSQSPFRSVYFAFNELRKAFYEETLQFLPNTLYQLENDTVIATEDKLRLTGSKNAKVIFYILQKLDGTSYLDSEYPQNSDGINYYKFINEFSQNISKIDGTIPYKIGFFEENDLNRLKILKDKCSETVNAFGNPYKMPLIYDDNKPVIVIGEEWLMKSVYTPSLSPELLKNRFKIYPITDDDRENFGEDSEYRKVLLENRKAFNEYTFSLFGESPSNDVLNIMNKSEKPFDAFGIPVFVANDPRGNVLSYSLQADKQQHTTTYHQLLKYMKQEVDTDLLRPIRKTIYTKYFNYEKLLEDLTNWYAHKTKPTTEAFRTELISRLVPTGVTKSTYNWSLYGTPFQTRAVKDFFEEYEGSGATFDSGGTTAQSFEETLLNLLLDDLLQDIQNSTNSNVPTVGTPLQLNPLLVRQRAKEELYKKLFVISLKTLPFFHVNNIEKLYSGCFLVLKSLVNVTNPPVTDYSFLTGAYFMQCFRHVITNNSAYSEFTLVKNPNIGALQ